MKMKTKKQRLSWIVNLVNQDIDKLKDGELLKIIFEIEENIPTFYFSVFRELWTEEDTKLKQMKREVVMQLLESPLNSRNIIKDAQQRFKNLLEEIIRIKDVGKEGYFPIREYTFSKVVNAFPSKGSIMIAPKESWATEIEYYLINLIYECSPDAFSGFRSVNYIKQCQAPKGRRAGKCQNFFLQLYKKEKNYCSTKCAWRAHSASRRNKGKRPRHINLD